MEHVVFFPAPDGAPAFRRVASLEEAVRLVEHLRNVEGVAEVAVHPLGAEVPLAFRAWYRVEVPASEAAPTPVVERPVAVEPVAVEQPVGVEPVAEQPAAVVPEQQGADEEQVANGHGKDAVPSLGFFA